MQLSTPIAARIRPLAAALIVAGAAVALALTLPAAGEAGKRRTEDVTVMNRNLYLGAPSSALADVTEATSFEQLTKETAEIVDEIQRTDFPARAKLLAREIASSKADLVGLQEVALWRVDVTEEDGTDDSDGDLGEQFGGTPAETVIYDFLAILQRELRRLDARYKVAHVQQEADVEMPVENRSSGFDAADSGDPYYDGRMTIRDVILARKGGGVRTSNARGGNFDTAFALEVFGQEIPFTRGWQSVNANVRGTRFRFVNTHLESFDQNGATRAAQARELVRGPAKSKKDLALVGDLNSSPYGPQSGPKLGKALRIVLDAGFVIRQPKGDTYGHDPILNDPNDRRNFNRKIDFIFVNNPRIRFGDGYRTGLDPKQRTPSGLWPSDHAGLFSTLEFPTCTITDPRC
jgi:endonuclease/exonuclease/phosphatase family metal-dependent hydrolase